MRKVFSLSARPWGGISYNINEKSLPWGKYGYFMELHIDLPVAFLSILTLPHSWGILQTTPSCLVRMTAPCGHAKCGLSDGAGLENVAYACGVIFNTVAGPSLGGCFLVFFFKKVCVKNKF